MRKIYSQSQYDIHFAESRRNIVEIQLLDYNTERKVGILSGLAIDGSIDINNDSSIRRTCKIKMILDDNTIPDLNSFVWINRKIRVMVGIEDTNTGNKEMFNKGCYVISNPSINYSTTDRSIEIEAVDYMALYDGKLNGKIGAKVIIDAGGNLSEAIKAIATQAGITKLNIEPTTFTVPSEITKDESATYYDVMKELTDLYRNFELFFDENGVLIFQRIKKYNTDPTTFDFSKDSDGDLLVTSSNVTYNFENAKNHVIVWGGVLSDSSQHKGEKTNNNPNHPFSTVAIGTTRTDVITDDKLQTQEQVDDRAIYELDMRSNFAETLTINCINVYALDVNNLIQFTNDEIKQDGRFLVTSMSLPFSSGSQMSINATKVYVI